jgi:hypothetical protein
MKHQKTAILAFIMAVRSLNLFKILKEIEYGTSLLVRA